ncbi:MAG: hypothetical protein KAI47_07975 [Deltaproteobacteria bacterium]|nr:hypothetical protein [Deltaproteobacteria bacterium]
MHASRNDLSDQLDRMLREHRVVIFYDLGERNSRLSSTSTKATIETRDGTLRCRDFGVRIRSTAPAKAINP